MHSHPIVTVVCSGCPRVKRNGLYVLLGRAVGILSHGLCPECRARLYPFLRRTA